MRSRGTRQGDSPGGLPSRLTWLRPIAPLPEDPVLHAAAIVLASDSALLATVGLFYGRMDRTTSMDHAVWFHGPLRFDDWILYASRSPAASDARSLTEARMYRPDGRLIAAVAQETFLAR
jgi:acyl-CoA thioesterase-2